MNIKNYNLTPLSIILFLTLSIKANGGTTISWETLDSKSQRIEGGKRLIKNLTETDIIFDESTILISAAKWGLLGIGSIFLSLAISSYIDAKKNKLKSKSFSHTLAGISAACILGGVAVHYNFDLLTEKLNDQIF